MIKAGMTVNDRRKLPPPSPVPCKFIQHTKKEFRNTGQRYKLSRMIISSLEKLWRGREEGIKKEGVKKKRQRERENEWE